MQVACRDAIPGGSRLFRIGDLPYGHAVPVQEIYFRCCFVLHRHLTHF